MSRVHAVCVLVLSLSGAHTVRAEQDGPGPVNTTRSVSAGADDDIAPQADAETPSGNEHAFGTYMGVVPGSATPPPAAVPAGKGPATITWPGFQMRADGTSRVFVQSSAPLEPEVKTADGKLLVHLPGARVVAETNRLPLETRFFNTPVTKVSLSLDRSGATLVLDLRAPVTPQITSERGSTGYFFMYIDLPRGNFVSGAPAHAPSGPNVPPALADEKPRPDAESAAKVDAAVSGKVSAEPASVKASGHVRAGIKLR